MHQYFRQYAQQMGMQNVRAILPEQIDILINTSISDTVNQIIKENIGITSDRVITDNSKLGSVNALSSLYRVEVHTVCAQDEQDRTGMFSQGDNNGHIIHLRTTVEDITSMGGSMFTVDINYLYIVDFAINYKRDKFVTNYFPIRVIDDVYLADVLNDFVLCPRFRSPVMTIYNNEFDANDIGYPEFNLYIDKGETIWYDDIECVGAKLYNGLVPNDIRISYIGKPNKVEFNEDNEGNSIDCNLPSYMHVDIVKHAVDLYHTALQGSLYAAQQAQQVQQRENIRNNAQPSN